ncbi:hypothetical protein MNBD_DELTA01-1886 [hydrothermal vent metagenome]|uniref:Uncharacterized protein n=1 Tax=hydrothermal vent metagenome TaxID=652676 RepID=A0A3B0QXI6_9ZZZZ
MLAVTIDDSVKHIKSEPLLILVSVSNREAAAARARNRVDKRQLARYKKTKAYKGLSKKEREEVALEYAPQEVSEYVLGSGKRSVAELIEFEVRNSSGKIVKFKPRVLAGSYNKREAMTFGAGSFVGIYFGIEGRELARLAAGPYTIKASIDTTEEKGMWRGRVASEPWAFELIASKRAAGTLERLSRKGDYYRLDLRFKKLKKVAKRVIKKDPASVRGWIHKGDAEAGLGRPADALSSFFFAEKYYYEDVERRKPPIVESPIYILRRIRAMEKKLNIIVEE